jgi:hypothetical protein
MKSRKEQAVVKDENNVEQKKEFQIERYKYILQEIHALNQNFHNYLTLFQTLASAIIGIGVSLFVSRTSLNIQPDVAKVGIESLLGLLILLTVFVIASITAGIYSWFDYRKEEVELLNQVVGVGFRANPNVRNIWRWRETYLILFILLFTAAVYFFVEVRIVPLIK